MRILILILLLSSVLATTNYHPTFQTSTALPNTTLQYIQEFPLNRSGAVPGPIAVAPDGTVWFAETNAGRLGRLDPATKNITEFQFRNSSTYILSKSSTRIINSVATDSEGNVWFTLSAANAIGYMNTTSQTFTYYNLTLLTHRSANSFPFGITIDSPGHVWFAELGASRIGSLNPVSRSLSEYFLPQPNASPVEVYSDKSHIIWVTSYWYTNPPNEPKSGSTLTRLDPSTNYTRHYDLTTGGIFTPVGVAVDDEGRAWIGDHGGSWLGEVNTLTGDIEIHRTSLPPLVHSPHNLTDRVYGGASFSLVNDVVLATDGTPWFLEHLGGRVGDYIPSTRTLVEYNVPTLTPATLWLAADHQGGIWFTEEVGNKIGYLDTRIASPPFKVSPMTLTSPIPRGASVSLTLTVTNNSTYTLNITAGIENTNQFYGPTRSLTLASGDSQSITVELDSYSYTLLGNYSSALLAPLTPVVKITDGSASYPVTVLVLVTDSSWFTQPIWIYTTLVALAAAVTVMGTALLHGRRRNILRRDSATESQEGSVNLSGDSLSRAG